MNVLMVVPSYYPIKGGSETVVQILSTRLNEKGIHADIMTYNMHSKWNPVWREEIENINSLKVVKVPAFNPDRFLPINPFKILLMNVIPKPSFVKKLKDYDIIHFHSAADLGFLLFSYFVKKPKIFHSHSEKGPLNYSITGKSINESMKGKLIMGGYRKILPHLADLYIGTNEKHFLDLGISKSKIVSFPFGVDTDVFRPDIMKKIDSLILFVGRIAEEKGLHILLKCLSYLKIPIHLVIIGPKWDVEHTEACLRTIEEINEDGVHRVEYLGAMNFNALIPWYQKAIVLVRPDLSGNSGGITCLEALACGTPVIGTGNRVLIDGVNGIIVPPNNPKKLAEALEKLLENKELREKYGNEGIRIVKNKFSLEFITNKLINIYKTILTT